MRFTKNNSVFGRSRAASLASARGGNGDGRLRRSQGAKALASIIGKRCGVQGALVRACPHIVHWAEPVQDQRELYRRLIGDLPDDLLP
jgi:hypothetical protein